MPVEHPRPDPLPAPARPRSISADRARLEYLALLAIVSGLTAVWLSLWVRWWLGAWFAGLPLPRLWPAGLALAGLASAVLTEFALGQRLIPQRAARAALAGLGALVVLLLVGWALGLGQLGQALWYGPHLAGLIAPGALPFLAALFIWWQGERIGRSPLGNRVLQSAFYTGVVALAPLLVLNSLLGALTAAQVLAGLMLFFALSLSGLALASLRHQRQQQRSSGRVALALSRQWLLISAGVIGLVLGAGMLAARWIDPQALEQLSASLSASTQSLLYGVGLALGPLIVWLEGLLAAGLPGLAAFVERFLTALVIALERLQSLVAMLMQLLTRASPGGLNFRRLLDFIATPAFQAGARWSGLLLVLAVAAIIFWLAARRLWGQTNADADELRESVLSGRLLLAQLKNLLTRRPRRHSPAASNYLSLTGGPDDARLIIRRAYQAMLEWARSLRLPRAAGQTPRAYAQMLAGAMPEGYDAIDLLTQAYVLARYAAETPSLEQAQRAEGALARLMALHS